MWGPRILAFILGVGLLLALQGYMRIFRSVFGPTESLDSLVLSTALLCGAIGPWAARRAALFLVRFWVGAFRGAPVADVRASRAHRAAKQESYAGLEWLLQSMLGVVLGVLVLGGLPAATGVQRAWAAMSARFFWTPTTAMIAMGLLMAGVVGLAGMAAGLHLATLYSAASRSQSSTAGASKPEAGITASILAGAAASLVLFGMNDPPGLSADQWVLLGAVPMFGISILAAFIARKVEQEADRSGAPLQEQPLETPEWSSSGEPRRLLLASVAAGGIGAALWMSSVRFDGQALAAEGDRIGIAWLLAAMASGAAISERPAGRRRYSMGGCGLTLWATAVAMLVGIIVGDPANHDGAHRIAATLAALFPAACLGYAVPYLRRAYVGRLGSERQALARWTAAILCGLVAGAGGHAWFASAPGSNVSAMAASCLTLLVFGGLLLIHEQGGQRRLRRRRVGLVFASLGVAVLVLPTAARRAATEAAVPRPAGPSSPGTAGLVNALGLALPGAQVACIGDDCPILSASAWRIDLVPWHEAPATTEHPGTATRPASLAGPPRPAGPLGAWWRTDRARYDLIVQSAAGLSPDEAAARLSWEWFEILRTKLLPSGALLVELPLAYMDARAIASAEETFAEVFASQERWRVVHDDGTVTATYLLATSPAAAPKDIAAPLGRPRGSPPPISLRRLTLAETRTRRIPLNTLRTPAFRGSLPANAP